MIGGDNLMKGLCILFIGLFVLSSSCLVLASNEKDPKPDVGECMKEILSTLNEIIKSTIKLAEAELKELQKELKEGGGSIQNQAEKSIAQGLQRILAELRKVEKALEKNLAEREGLSEEKWNRYLENREKLEERVGHLKKTIVQLSEEIRKKCALLKESIREKGQDVLKEMERIISRMEERLKRQKRIDGTLST